MEKSNESTPDNDTAARPDRLPSGPGAEPASNSNNTGAGNGSQNEAGSEAAGKEVGEWKIGQYSIFPKPSRCLL